MERTNLEKYFSSIANLNELRNRMIINYSDYIKAEAFFAEKYCINKGNLYRCNGLINSDFRAMYMTKKEEKHNGNEDSKKDRCITKIRKEN